jgi:hypothetical protein
MKDQTSSLYKVKERMRQHEEEEYKKKFRDDLRSKTKLRMEEKRQMELDLKMKKEESSQQLVQKFKQEEAEQKTRRMRDKQRKIKEEKEKQNQILKNREIKLREMREKDVEAQRMIDEMMEARKKIIITEKKSPLIQKPKGDPNKVKFNVTELIKNRNSKNPSIVKSDARDRVQSNNVKNEKSPFSSKDITARNLQGYMSAVENSSPVNVDLNGSFNSHDATIDTKRKLPSLQRRLNKRLVQPLYYKATKQMEQRKMESLKKIAEIQKRDEMKKLEIHKRKKVLDRLTILGNINVSPNNSKNASVRDIWKAHDDVLNSVKKSAKRNNATIHLTSYEDPAMGENNFKDSLDKEIMESPENKTRKRNSRFINQISSESYLYNSEIEDENTLQVHPKLKKRKMGQKKAGRKK